MDISIKMKCATYFHYLLRYFGRPNKEYRNFYDYVLCQAHNYVDMRTGQIYSEEEMSVYQNILSASMKIESVDDMLINNDLKYLEIMSEDGIKAINDELGIKVKDILSIDYFSTIEIEVVSEEKIIIKVL